MAGKRLQDDRGYSPRARWLGFAIAAVALAGYGFTPPTDSHAALTSRAVFTQEVAQQDQSSASASASAASVRPVLPRGKKLMLKDGNFQLVREYKVEGDRVRYYSVDSHQWEEMPAALVDWDATHKVEEEQAKRDAATVARVHTIEKARTADMMDIDASLEAAPGVFIPPSAGAYVFAGKSVLQLEQAETDSKIDKGRVVKQILVPIPIVPSRHSISIKGTRAKLRISDSQPEFYVRTADAHEPQMELIRTKVKGYTRLIENVDSLFRRESTKADLVPMQQWPIAHGVYRFTLGQPLEPGEYALAEVVLEETTSIYVWDIGVDAGSPAPATKPK